ncbi:MAG: RNA chaperone Hfq [Acidobacteriota bacterium]|nr:RNA chaperone Hfq [Blastocatellia bacterium]MDW8411596.1 RNA chaperone Hfq [Acidobacteriota bacterium]
MDKQMQNLQDGFLNQARRERLVVTIYLLSGVKLTGKIKGFDKYSVILDVGEQELLIFKHAISTVALPKGISSKVLEESEAGAEKSESATSLSSR